MYHAVSDISEDEAASTVNRQEQQTPDLLPTRDNHDQDVVPISEPREYHAVSDISEDEAAEAVNRHEQETTDLRPTKGKHDQDVAFINKPREKGSFDAPKWIVFYAALASLLMLCFSAVLLGILIKNWIETVDSTSDDAVALGYYIVDFAAARLIFVSSWSSSVAPWLASIMMGLYLFRTAKGLLKRSSTNEMSRLPTPYQLVLLIGLSTGSLAHLWNRCTSLDDFHEYPCTYVRAVTGQGLEDSSETTSVFSDRSTQHSLFNFTTPVSDGSDASLIFLGPASSSISNELEYTASTIGVQTSCKPISQLCQLSAPIGAATPYNCSSGFYGDLQSITLNSTATSWKANDEHLVFGADFLDDNFTQPYNNYSSQEDRSDISVSPGHNLPSSWYMAVAFRLDFGVKSSNIPNDPEITIPVHGGAAFILRCQIATYDVKYTSFNGSLSHVSTTLANGSVAWLYNSLIPAPAVAGGLSIDGLVASIFEDEGGIIEGAEIEKCFSENTQDSAVRVGLHEERPAGEWFWFKWN
ncbi:hypothetical protein K456DRAFT_1918822 [Colletotrichum gloeosporioides 23]|nr:hypothetical protein K456DRAFT_1918822 [Colletotrichum gloeosporioides 23]